MTSVTRDGRPRDAGFTVVELMTVTAIMAVISVTLGASIAVVLRATPRLASTTQDAQNQVLILNYFQSDVSAAGASAVDLAVGAGGCSGADPGFNVLQLTTTDANVVRRVTYRLRAVSGRGVLERRECAGTSLAALGVIRTAVLARDLPAPPANWAGGAPAAVSLVSGNVRLALTQQTRTITLSARLRTDLAVLP